MKRLTIKACYGQEFLYIKLPNLFLKLIVAELRRPINITILTYIRDTYNITISQLIVLLQNNLRISRYADNIIIDFVSVKIKEEILEDGSISTLYLDTLLNFINYGNLQFRGSNIINNIITYLQENIDTLHKLSKVRGGSNLWR